MESIQQRYLNAAKGITDKLKTDPNVIAVILLGSLAYDTVWEKSDIDMTVVIRDQKISTDSYCIIEDNITVNLDVIQRSSFKRGLEHSIGGTFLHSLNSKGKILYSNDDSLLEFFEESKEFGRSDAELAMLYTSGSLSAQLEKAEKWVRVKHDLLYARYYILKIAEQIAFMEVCSQFNNVSPTREVIQQAMSINPELIDTFYTQPMNNSYNEEQTLELIDKIDKFLESKMEYFSRPLIEYMSDGEIKTVTMLTKYFKLDSHFLSHSLEYMSEKGLFEKVSQSIRVTPKGKQIAEEMAFIYIKED